MWSALQALNLEWSRSAIPILTRGRWRDHFGLESRSINFWRATCCSGVVTYGSSWELAALVLLLLRVLFCGLADFTMLIPQ